MTPQTRQPYELTAQEWKSRRAALKADYAQQMPTKGDGSRAARRIAEVEDLTFGVGDWLQSKMTPEDRADEFSDLSWRFNNGTTHKDVIEKALEEGKQVPANVLAEYPDLAKKQEAK